MIPRYTDIAYYRKAHTIPKLAIVQDKCLLVNYVRGMDISNTCINYDIKI